MHLHHHQINLYRTRRTRLLYGCAALFAALLAGLIATPAARAQNAEDGSGSYITPFPEGDTYQVMVIGDSLAEGVKGALAQTLARDARVNLVPKRRSVRTVMKGSVRRLTSDLKAELSQANVHVAVVMMGLGDRIAFRDSERKWHKVGTVTWRKKYTRTIDAVMKALKKLSIAVYWVGLPSVRRPKANAHYVMMNEIIRERAYFNGFKYIDAYTTFSDERGGFSPYGPDVTGKTKLLRTRDGVHFTYDGYYKLAHFIERELKRDLKQAQSYRSIPLAGDKAEQARIAAASNETEDKKSADWRTSISSKGPDGDEEAAKKSKTSKDEGPKTGYYGNKKGGEQKADNTRINLKTVSGGREKVVSLEIVRPAIPASIVALVTRKERPDRPSRMGDTLIDQVPGGLSVMNSVTPANEVVAGGANRKVSPARTPFFRVLVKGERLASKPGRADDISWPRPEPPPLAELRSSANDAGAANRSKRRRGRAAADTQQ